VWCKLGEVCDVENGYAFKSQDYKENGIPLIRISNIQEGKISLTNTIYIDKTVNEQFIVKRGDLLIAMSGATTGKMGIYENEEIAYLNQRVGNIRIKNEKLINNQYRDYCLMSQKDYILELAYGGAQPNISSAIISSLNIPLPPLAEQQRIVAEVDKLFTLIDQLEEDKTALQQLITQLKSKILSLAIHGQLVAQDANDTPAEELLKQINPEYKSSGNLHYKNLPKGWAMCKLGEVCEAERGITFPSSAKKFQFEEGTIACLRTANVQELLDIEDLWYIDESYLKGNKRKYIQIGDVMMSTANSRELVGKVSFVRELDKPMSFGGFIMALRAKGIHSEYLYIVLRTLFLEGYFSKIASQTTNIANLNTRNLNEIDILLPPLAEQQRISEKITELFNIIDTIQNALNS